MTPIKIDSVFSRSAEWEAFRFAAAAYVTKRLEQRFAGTTIKAQQDGPVEDRELLSFARQELASFENELYPMSHWGDIPTWEVKLDLASGHLLVDVVKVG